MAMIAVWLKVDEESLVAAFKEAGEKLDGVEGELALDFSSVLRISPSALKAMAEVADLADHKGVKVVLRGVNLGVYKVLKLVKLTSRFSFVS
ncbi:MAG: STAS domain-containing protein [Candidatus Sulfotelmatobacter sp.]